MIAPAQPSAHRVRLDGLDALRGIAAVAVFLLHAAPWPRANAYLAVDFFFMLSGYVMARTYEAGLGDAGAAARFLRGRLARLGPVMALASLLGLPALFSNAPWDVAVRVALANLFLIPTFAANQIYLLNPPAWSIGLELLANAAHAGIMHRLRRTLGRIVLVLAVAAFIVAAGTMGTVDLGSHPENYWLGPVRVFASYGIGIALWRRWRDVPPLVVPAWATFAAMPAWFVGVPVLAGIMGLSRVPWWADCGFVLALCPLLIAGGLQAARGSRLAAAAGALSFPLYAVHGPVLLTLRVWGAPLVVQMAGALFAAVVLQRIIQSWTAIARRTGKTGKLLLTA